MFLNPRRLVLPLILASFLLVTISPSALHAQNTQTQSQSTTTKAKNKKKSRKTKKSEAENSAAEANSSTNAASSSTTPAESSHTAAKSERSHATSASSVHAQTPPSPGMVWVNTETGVYHKSGSRWYGKTKQGKWMTEADAQKAGYKSAKH